MTASPRATDVLLALLGGACAFGLALVWAPSIQLAGEVIPTGHDSFYHARRILDTVADPAAFYEFDRRIHAPEGSYLTWPWAYDRGAAALVRLITALAPTLPAPLVLAYLPATWGMVNAALIAAITGRARLPVALRAIGVLAFAVSPLTQSLHGLGRIDHHLVEHTWVLGTLWLGMRWLDAPDKGGRALALGLLIGVGPGLHNGLFLLALPILAGFAVLRLRRFALPAPAVAAWAGGLMLGTLAVLLPSEPFRLGFFAYYWLSWFHLYAACAAALLGLLVVRLPAGRGGLAGIAALGAVLAVPLLTDIAAGLELIGAQIDNLAEMGDTASILGLGEGRRLGLAEATRAYSALVWLLPLTLAWQALELRRESAASLVYFHLVCLLGALMLIQQYRFHHFGSIAIYLPWLLLAARLTGPDASPARARLTAPVAAAVAIAAYLPTVPTLMSHPVPGFSADYFLTRPLYSRLAEVCARDPGVVLAEHHDGHYIRFHTECSVIANNFLTTPQHTRKIALAQRLLAGSSGAVRERRWIRYVLIRRADNIFDTVLSEAEVLRRNPGLQRELLFGTAPAGFELVTELRLPGVDGPGGVLARLWRVGPASPAPSG